MDVSRKRAQDAFEHFWSQALLTVSTAEDEAARFVGRFSAATSGWSAEDVRRQVRELSDRLALGRRDVEAAIEQTAHAAVQRLRVPRRDEVEKLNARLESLARRVEALKP